MIGSTKNKFAKSAGSGLLLLLILGLAGFGATNFGGTVNEMGKVGNTPIQINRYARELSGELRAFEAQTGMAFTFEQARAFGLDQQVLNRVIDQVALENEAGVLGVSVGDALVRDQIVKIPAFAGANGTFDPEAYRFALRNAGISVTEFETQIRAELSRTLVQNAVSAGATMPSSYGETLMGWLGERRDLAWIAIGADDLDSPLPEPTEAELTAYYEANPEAFTSPAAKNITYAWLSPEMAMSTDAVDDLELRKLYDERRAEYVTPERRLVERLVFGSEADAQAAFDSITAGTTDFAKLVAERGLTLSDVDLGDVSADDLGAAAGPVFALDAPGVVGPVETDLGPALMRVNAILPAQETTFEEARDELADEYMAEAARRDISARIDGIDDLLAGGATLEELAGETGMTLGMIRWTPDATDGIAAFSEFSDVARDVAQGDYPEVHQLQDGGIFALRLDGEVGPELQPMADVRDAVIAGWEKAETAERLAAQGDALVQRMQAGEAIDALGGTVTRVPDATRSSFLDNTPDTMLTTLFDASVRVPQVITGDIDAQPMAFVAMVEAVKPAANDDPDALQLRTQVDAQTAQSVAQDVLDAFTSAVRIQAGVDINQAAVNAVHANLQ